MHPLLSSEGGTLFSAVGAYLLSPEGGLLAIFLSSLIAATLFPLPSEVVLFGYTQLHPEHTAIAIAIATVGNTLGGMSTYAMGRWIPAHSVQRLTPRALAWLYRWGASATALAFLPLIGDALCLAAGWLRLNAWSVLWWMSAGRLARYLSVAGAGLLS